jgi:integrase
VTLDENKTDDPRAWALSPGVTEAMRAWRGMRAHEGADVSDDALVFVDENGEPIGKVRVAERYREHLRAAGITRAVLFEQSRSRQRIRLHDTRATFITVALANGKSEAWVQDRTGHRSSTMINRYRRLARTVAELGLGGFVRMDEAIWGRNWGHQGESCTPKISAPPVLETVPTGSPNVISVLNPPTTVALPLSSTVKSLAN